MGFLVALMDSIDHVIEHGQIALENVSDESIVFDEIATLVNHLCEMQATLAAIAIQAISEQN